MKVKKKLSQLRLRKCAVEGCIEPSETTYGLPQDPLVCDQWLKFLENDPKTNPINRFARVCKKHFTDSDFTRTSLMELSKRLKKTAVPKLIGPVPGSSSNNNGISTILKVKSFFNVCSVPQCPRPNNKSVHLLPSNKNYRRKWLKAIKLNEKQIIKNFRVCEIHFLPTDFFRTHTARKKMLLKGAIPSRNLPKTSHKQKTNNKTDNPNDNENVDNDNVDNDNVNDAIQAKDSESTSSENFRSEAYENVRILDENLCKVRNCTRPKECKSIKLPKNEVLRDKWLQQIDESKQNINFDNFYVCSKHFRRSDFMIEKKQEKLFFKLKKGRFPSLNIPMNVNSKEPTLNQKTKVEIKKCSIESCQSSSSHKVVFYSLPQDDKLAKKWKIQCGLSENVDIPKNFSICNTHFLPTDYREGLHNGVIVPSSILKRGVVPTLNLPDGNKLNKNNIKKLCSVQNCSMTSKKCENLGIGCYKFPSNPTLRKKWMQKLHFKRQPKLFAKVCGWHFKRSDFMDAKSGKQNCLKKTAIPSRNLQKSVVALKENSNKKPKTDVNLEDMIHIDLDEIEDDIHPISMETDAPKTNAVKILKSDGGSSVLKVDEVNPRDLFENVTVLTKENLCGVPNCIRPKGYSSIALPSDISLKNKWLRQVFGQVAKLNIDLSNFYVCTRHFKKNDFIIVKARNKTILKLKKNGVPTLNLVNMPKKIEEISLTTDECFLKLHSNENITINKTKSLVKILPKPTPSNSVGKLPITNVVTKQSNIPTTSSNSVGKGPITNVAASKQSNIVTKNIFIGNILKTPSNKVGKLQAKIVTTNAANKSNVSTNQLVVKQSKNVDIIPTINLKAKLPNSGTELFANTKNVVTRQFIRLQDPFWIKDITLSEEPMPNVNLSKSNDKISNDFECSVVNCYATSKTNPSFEFYPLPTCSLNMPSIYQSIENKQRSAWLASIIFKRANNISYICSKHFHTGKPANVLNYCHVDWAPSIALGKPNSRAITTMKYNSYKHNMSEWLFENASEEDITANKPTIYEPIVNPDSSETFNNNASNKIEDNNKINKNYILSDTDDDDDDDSMDDKLFDDEPSNMLDKPFTIHVSPAILIKTALTPPITCEKCTNSFHYITKYYEHKLKNLICLGDYFSCEICDETISLNKTVVDIHKDNNLQVHIKSHLIEEKYHCQHCKRYEKGSIMEQNQHILKLFGERKHICSMCRQTYSSLFELKLHECDDKLKVDVLKSRRKQKIEKTICELCGKCVSDILGHMKFHKNVRPYKCNKCDNRFRTIFNVVRHQQAHRKRKIVCYLCGKKFLWCEPYHNHMKKSHPSDNPLITYKCSHCSSKYFHEQEVTIHEQNHLPYECKHCTQAFKKLNLLSEHHYAQHSELPLENNGEIYTKMCPTLTIDNYNYPSEYWEKSESERKLLWPDSEENKPEPPSYAPMLFKLLRDSDIGNNNKNQQQVAYSNSKNVPSNLNTTTIGGDDKKIVLKEIAFQCKQCNMNFKNELLLFEHRSQAHNKRYRCKTCGIETKDIAKHILIHRQPCTKCKLMFGSSAALTEHNLKFHCNDDGTEKKPE